jgi:hypothetical protein
VERNDLGRRLQRFCPNCGASNPIGAVHCSSCGSLLPEQDDLDEPGETVIDVSSGQPQVLEEEPPADSFWRGGFTTIRMDQSRVYVTQGGRRTCLIVLLVALLLTCCVCWLAWNTVDSVF